MRRGPRVFFTVPTGILTQPMEVPRRLYVPAAYWESVQRTNARDVPRAGVPKLPQTCGQRSFMQPTPTRSPNQFHRSCRLGDPPDIRANTGPHKAPVL